MMQKISLLILLLVFVLQACKKPSSAIEGYTKDEAGFYYKLLSFGDGNERANSTQVVVLEVVMSTLSDSIFWDTYHDSQDDLYIDLSKKQRANSCNHYFKKVVEGDSISFYVNPTTFFRDYFDTIVPAFCLKDSLIKLNVKVNQIISKAEYQKIKKMAQEEAEEDLELQELEKIDAYLVKDYPSIKPDGYGIYWLDKEENNGEPVTWGKRVNIDFQGFYLDGRPIAQGEQSMEFNYGTPDQIINGLNIVIGKLKNGEIAKIILPSRLAFGEKGTSNGSIKPYTPIVYELKITDVKSIIE